MTVSNSAVSLVALGPAAVFLVASTAMLMTSALVERTSQRVEGDKGGAGGGDVSDSGFPAGRGERPAAPSGGDSGTLVPCDSRFAQSLAGRARALR
jgi:hypothetical protein